MKKIPSYFKIKKKTRNQEISPNTLEKLRPSKKKRDFLTLIFLLTITFSSLAFISYQDTTGNINYSSQIPSISIEVPKNISNISQNCFLKISPVSNEDFQSTWANHFIAANIRKRNTDDGFSIELNQAENILHIRNDDDWLLLPSKTNSDAFRTKIAFDIYNMLIEDNLDNVDIRLPDSELVDVYINNDYQDVYLLSERIDRSSLNLYQEDAQNLENNDMIFKSTNWDGDFYTQFDESNSSWEQLYPNELNFSYIPLDLTSFISNSSEEDFFNENNGIFTKFNKDLLINNLLFGLFLGHGVIEGSSYYLVYNQKNEAKFSFLPWNFEQSWGFTKDGTVPLDYWINVDENHVENVVWSQLYYRLLFPEDSTLNKGFITDIINHWSFIRNSIWKTANLNSHIDEIYQKIENSKSESIKNSIKNWIQTRLNWLDNIINNQIQTQIFVDNFETPFQENNVKFGFSSPSARRYYYKSSVLFKKDKIHEIDITIQKDYALDMIYRRNDEDPATEHFFMPSTVSIDNYSMSDVGLRIRGYFNLNFPKSSFKLKFSETNLYIGNSQSKYIPEYKDRRFLGLKRLNLRSGYADYTMMNEPVGHELFKMVGIPALRISWVKLYITLTDEEGTNLGPREYKGLYWLTEDLDKTFLRCNFKDPDANLYKTTPMVMATLHDVENISNYFRYDMGWKDWGFVRFEDLKGFFPNYIRSTSRVYELRTNEELDDYSDFEKFVHYINNNWTNIQEVADLDSMAKYFAASHFQGSWDDYCGIPHNYFLYSNPNGGFCLLAWDIENNFNMGSNQSNTDWGQPDYRYAPLLDGYREYFNWDGWWLPNWVPPAGRPLWDNAINDPCFVDKFLNSLNKIVEGIPKLIVQTNTWFNLINETILLPYNHTFSVNRASINTKTDYDLFMNEKDRILNFLQGRKEFVEEQLSLFL
ncbi:MAG: CotH kinase family protein [Promethearchaeota archaeon]